MSNGRTHAVVASVVIVAAAIATPYVASHANMDVAAGMMIGAIAGYFCTPDIDLDQCISHEEYRIKRWFGKYPFRLYVWFWMGYARKHSHRGSSHKPIVGTAGRWWHVITHLLFLPLVLIFMFPQLALAAFVMNVGQDIGHLIFDKWNYHGGK